MMITQSYILNERLLLIKTALSQSINSIKGRHKMLFTRKSGLPIHG